MIINFVSDKMTLDSAVYTVCNWCEMMDYRIIKVCTGGHQPELYNVELFEEFFSRGRVLVMDKCYFNQHNRSTTWCCDKLLRPNGFLADYPRPNLIAVWKTM